MRKYLKAASDRELVRVTATGDGRAFGELFKRYGDAILAYCLRLTRRPEVAADLMSETFATALVAISRGQADDVDTPAAWLFRIARNKTIDAERRGRVDAAARELLMLEPLVLDDADIARINELGAGEEILALLPRELSEIVRARIVDEVEYWEIARAFDCSEQVVRKRVSRGLTRLRARFQEAGL
jgi:RNA polymerase sigma-70 factor (ECF subfamily)